MEDLYFVISQAELNDQMKYFLGHPVMFIKLKDNKMFSGYNETQKYIILS